MSTPLRTSSRRATAAAGQDAAPPPPTVVTTTADADTGAGVGLPGDAFPAPLSTPMEVEPVARRTTRKSVAAAHPPPPLNTTPAPPSPAASAGPPQSPTPFTAVEHPAAPPAVSTVLGKRPRGNEPHDAGRINYGTIALGGESPDDRAIKRRKGNDGAAADAPATTNSNKILCFRCNEEYDRKSVRATIPPDESDWRCQNCLGEDANDDVCFVCEDENVGGALLCCETCPRTAHTGCDGLEAAPEGDWHCFVCRMRRGTPIMAKMTGHPRWPAIHTNRQNTEGDLECVFFGGGEVAWMAAKEIRPYVAAEQEKEAAKAKGPHKKAFHELELFMQDNYKIPIDNHGRLPRAPTIRKNPVPNPLVVKIPSGLADPALVRPATNGEHPRGPASKAPGHKQPAASKPPAKLTGPLGEAMYPIHWGPIIKNRDGKWVVEMRELDSLSGRAQWSKIERIISRIKRDGGSGDRQSAAFRTYSKQYIEKLPEDITDYQKAYLNGIHAMLSDRSILFDDFVPLLLSLIGPQRAADFATDVDKRATELFNGKPAARAPSSYITARPTGATAKRPSAAPPKPTVTTATSARVSRANGAAAAAAAAGDTAMPMLVDPYGEIVLDDAPATTATTTTLAPPSKKAAGRRASPRVASPLTVRTVREVDTTALPPSLSLFASPSKPTAPLTPPHASTGGGSAPPTPGGAAGGPSQVDEVITRLERVLEAGMISQELFNQLFDVVIADGHTDAPKLLRCNKVQADNNFATQLQRMFPVTG